MATKKKENNENTKVSGKKAEASAVNNAEAEAAREKFQEKLKEVCASGEDLKLKDLKEASAENSMKTGDETVFTGSNAIEQKQEGLYALAWHPIGGMPDPAVFCELADAMEEIEGVELRLAPYEIGRAHV